MTEDQYCQLEKERPELLLPPYYRLHPDFREWLNHVSVDKFVGARCAKTLGRDNFDKRERIDGVEIW